MSSQRAVGALKLVAEEEVHAVYANHPGRQDVHLARVRVFPALEQRVPVGQCQPAGGGLVDDRHIVE